MMVIMNCLVQKDSMVGWQTHRVINVQKLLFSVTFPNHWRTPVRPVQGQLLSGCGNYYTVNTSLGSSCCNGNGWPVQYGVHGRQSNHSECLSLFKFLPTWAWSQFQLQSFWCFYCLFLFVCSFSNGLNEYCPVAKLIVGLSSMYIKEEKK